MVLLLGKDRELFLIKRLGQSPLRLFEQAHEAALVVPDGIPRLLTDACGFREVVADLGEFGPDKTLETLPVAGDDPAEFVDFRTEIGLNPRHIGLNPRHTVLQASDFTDE